MELKRELEKLESYFGNNDSKFKEQYKLLMKNFDSESGNQQIDKFIDNLVAKSMKESDETMKKIRGKYQSIMNKRHKQIESIHVA
jgi:hypothetical protein